MSAPKKGSAKRSRRKREFEATPDVVTRMSMPADAFIAFSLAVVGFGARTRLEVRDDDGSVWAFLTGPPLQDFVGRFRRPAKATRGAR